MSFYFSSLLFHLYAVALSQVHAGNSAWAQFQHLEIFAKNNNRNYDVRQK